MGVTLSNMKKKIKTKNPTNNNKKPKKNQKTQQTKPP